MASAGEKKLEKLISSAVGYLGDKVDDARTEMHHLAESQTRNSASLSTLATALENLLELTQKELWKTKIRTKEEPAKVRLEAEVKSAKLPLPTVLPRGADIPFGDDHPAPPTTTKGLGN